MIQNPFSSPLYVYLPGAAESADDAGVLPPIDVDPSMPDPFDGWHGASDEIASAIDADAFDSLDSDRWAGLESGGLAYGYSDCVFDSFHDPFDV